MTKTINEILNSWFTGGINIDNTDDEWGLNDLEEASATVTYCGYEKSDGAWNLIKIDTTTGYAVGWATVLNNPTRTSYTLGWNNRATLTYDDYTDAF